MSWTIYTVNVLKAGLTFQFSNDPDAAAEFIANQYDSAIKRGGDMIYGVPVLNGNVIGMANVIKAALKKGRESGGENFNVLAEVAIQTNYITNLQAEKIALWSKDPQAWSDQIGA